MQMNIEKSLWGDLPLSDTTRTPIVILREQATILTDLTNGLLEGLVTTRLSEGINKIFGGDASEFNATLSIVAPALDGYVFRILEVNHNLVPYPVEVVDLASSFFRKSDSTSICEDEESYTAAVGKVLSSDAVRQAVRQLLSQSKSTQPA